MAEQKGMYGPFALVARGDAGILLAVPNAEEAAVIVTRVIVDKTTGSDGAANLTVGIAANATTADNGLVTATALAGAAAVIDSAATGISQKWGANQYLTANGSADTTGLVGNVYIEYVRV